MSPASQKICCASTSTLLSKSEFSAVSLEVASQQPEWPQPKTVEDTGLDFLFLVELLTKVLFLRGQTSLIGLSTHLQLPVSVLDPLLSFMRKERMCEMLSRGDSNVSTYFCLSETGRARAYEYLQRNQYAGPAPVTLQDYTRQVENQTLQNIRYTKAAFEKVFHNFVINNKLLDQLGAAMNSCRSIFLYGPAGSGKTFIAETLVNLMPDNITIPYAIFVDNEIIQIFDPLVHKIVEQPSNGENLLERRNNRDMRWIICKRPTAISGGELTLETFDLQFDRTTRFYQAPPHMKANNGLYIVDDLGHQAISPRELMNRWIAPLDRRHDYLTLHTGYKFRIPFDVKVIFSSNLNPENLADDAFIRRIGYKIYIGELSEEQYQKIFQTMCQKLAIPYNEAAFRHLLVERHYKEGRPLLACFPRDLLEQVCDISLYKSQQPVLCEEILDWAWQNYFVTRQKGTAVTAGD